jgi:gliding motility-associated-like protein
VSCRIVDSIDISVNPNPSVDAVSDKDSIRKGEQVQLNAIPNTGFNFNWSPQDLVSDTHIANPTSSPTETTTYIVTISDQNGCTAFDSVTVTVYDLTCNKENAYIPNAFSPNGDGINDIFRARTKGMKNIKLIVYDRTGNKVFETTDLSAGWDGNYKNQEAPVDSYGYYFTGECLQGEKIAIRGNVTLMR